MYFYTDRRMIRLTIAMALIFGSVGDIVVGSLDFFPKTVAEVQDILLWASQHDTHIAIRGAGRGNSVKTTLEKAAILDQSHMNKIIHLDLIEKKITVQPGIHWSEIQEAINPFGLAIAAMQSYCDFSVGGTIGVNAHGQDFRYAPIAQTIESLVIVDANGQIQRLSPTENKELFSLVIGGYGLFGVIVEVTLQLVDNTVLQKHVEICSNGQVLSATQRVLSDPNIALYSARFDMSKKNFMSRMITISYHDTHEVTTVPLKAGGIVEKVRGYGCSQLFNATRQSKLLKSSRITVEDLVESKLDIYRSRNNAMFYKTDSLQHSNKKHTEILQEYFIPLSCVQTFIESARTVLRQHKVNVLNCTLRYVKKENISFLAYAPEDVAAFVFYYSINNSEKGFAYAQLWTRKLIDCALKSNGRFYLPYYCFATKKQVRKAYPQFDQFVQMKKKYDPCELFVNDLYLTYR